MNASTGRRRRLQQCGNPGVNGIGVSADQTGRGAQLAGLCPKNDSAGSRRRQLVMVKRIGEKTDGIRRRGGKGRYAAYADRSITLNAAIEPRREFIQRRGHRRAYSSSVLAAGPDTVSEIAS